MEVRQRGESGIRIVTLVGRLDEMATSEVESAFAEILKECDGPVLLNLGGVEYISSNGMRVLLLFSRELKRKSASLKLAALTPFVTEVFQISNFSKVFEIYPSVEAALHAFRGDTAP